VVPSGAMVAARAAALVLPLVALACAGAGCGGDDHGRAVAHVGGTAITGDRLDAAIDQLRADRRRKGEVEEFPEVGSRGYANLRDSVLGLLVFHVELEQAAERLGVEVGDDEVERLIDAGGGAPGEDEAGSLGREAREFARESVRAQLLYQRIYSKVTRGITGGNAAERLAQRRRAMSRFVARLRKRAQVRYEPGYAPGS